MSDESTLRERIARELTYCMAVGTSGRWIANWGETPATLAEALLPLVEQEVAAARAEVRGQRDVVAAVEALCDAPLYIDTGDDLHIVVDRDDLRAALEAATEGEVAGNAPSEPSMGAVSAGQASEVVPEGREAESRTEAHIKAEVLRDAANDVPLFEFMLVMDIASEVAPAQIGAWLRDRADRIEREAATGGGAS